MDQKLLFFDIDGTLLTGGYPGYLPDSTVQALEQARERGHKVIINTGRTWAFLPEPLVTFPFDGYVCGCGTQIILDGKEIFHYEIPADVRRFVPAAIRRSGFAGALEGRNKIYFDYDCNSNPIINQIREIYSQTTPADQLGSFSDPDPDFDKFIILSDLDADREPFKKELPDIFTVIENGAIDNSGFMEIIPKACSKATGIDFLASHFNLPLDACYVFGDSMNDLPMLTHVKHSIAMGNSLPAVLDIAEYVTTPADRDGIRNALIYYGLI